MHPKPYSVFSLDPWVRCLRCKAFQALSFVVAQKGPGLAQSCGPRVLDWVAVKELKINYHTMAVSHIPWSPSYSNLENLFNISPTEV